MGRSNSVPQQSRPENGFNQSAGGSVGFERLLSDTEAGELLGLHPKTVQRLARTGELPAIRIGRYWRFRASALDEWIDVHSTGQPACVGTERTR
jgi:excisionase family DNA binding protein